MKKSTPKSEVLPSIPQTKKILVAPLNWGLGHATRCIPIINALILYNYTPIIASDGDALSLLQKEFPELKYYELPSYKITYSKNGKDLKLRMLLGAPNILKAITNEKTVVLKIIKEEGVSGIISDNRFGVRSSKVPSVYITHQLKVLSGNTSFLTSLIHQKIIAKFDSCWIPDYNDNQSLAGVLSDLENSKMDIKYIGCLSRFSYKRLPKKQDLLVLLSGPEPQRTILEEKLFSELEKYDKKVLFVRGIISEEQQIKQVKKTRIINYMLKEELQTAINESELVLARSGFSTIMDMQKLKAKTFFIPTPGQFEQEYLAMYLDQKKIAPYTDQDNFKIEMLDEIKNYNGFIKKRVPNKLDFKTLFSIYFF